MKARPWSARIASRCSTVRPGCCPTATPCASRRARRARACSLLAGKPLGEPVVQYGPFVMNTHEEIEQAIADYQSGALTSERVRRIRVAQPQAN